MTSHDEFTRATASYYAERLRSSGPGPLGMDWKDAASQNLRFEVLLRQIRLADRDSVIDIGCGDGELLHFLRQRGFTGEYRGLDVCAAMVDACRSRFGALVAEEGSTADLARTGWRADYVVASGTFNVKQGAEAAEWAAYLRTAVCEMFAAARVAAVFNIMSSQAEQRYDRLFYLDPADVPAMVASCGAKRFVIDHSYPLFEQTVTFFR